MTTLRRQRLATRPPPDEAYADELRRIGLAGGLDAVGIAAAERWDDVERTLEQRKRDGLHAGMGFTYRNPARSADPTTALPDAAAIVVGAWRYRRTPPPAPPEQRRPTGRVASYAWIEHYAPLRKALREVAQRLKQDGWRARVLVDDNALVDREAAHRAGIGWYGKSANLLIPGRGSWFVLGGVVTDAPLPAASEEQRVADGCGPCRRCLDGCPTGAIVAPGVVEARRCLSWLLQQPGPFPMEHRAAVGDRLYGCDDCQEVCPPNRRADVELPPAPAEEGSTSHVDLVDLLELDDATILERHGAWYIPGRDPDHVRRNALVALGNSGAGDDPRVNETLRRYERHPNPLLREHAAWAAQQLAR